MKGTVKATKGLFVVVLSLLIACTCAFGLMTAAADEGTSGKGEVVYSNVHKVGTNYEWGTNIYAVKHPGRPEFTWDFTVEPNATAHNDGTDNPCYKIPSDYSYYIMDIEVEEGSQVGLKLTFKMGNNWLTFNMAEGVAYYVAPEGGTFTEKSYNTATGMEFTGPYKGTIVIPFESFGKDQGYSFSTLEFHHVTFYDLSATYDGKTSVTNIAFGDRDYAFPTVEGQVNKVPLSQAITAAKSAAEGIEVSEEGDGSDVGRGKYWVTSEVMEAYTKALAEAERLFESDEATQAEVDAAITALNLAVAGFETKSEGTMTSEDYGIIAETITVSKDMADIEMFKGGNVSDMTEFNKVKFTVDASEQTANVDLSIILWCNLGWEQGFTVAYSATKDLEPAENAMKPERDDKWTRADRYVLLKKDGEDAADRSPITSVKDQGLFSEMGYVTIPAGFKGDIYVPYCAFKMHYNHEGQVIRGSLNKVTVKSTGDVTGLTLTNFRLTTEEVDENLNVLSLETAIQTAQALLSSTKTSTDGADVSVTEKWATQAAKDTLSAAITVAQGVKEAAADGSKEQEEVDAATATLEAAIATFEAAVKDGTKNFYALLQQKITEAETARNSVVVATKSSEVDSDKYWVVSSVAYALTSAIEEAKEVPATASQAEFEAAIAKLDAAVKTLNEEKRLGSKTAPKPEKKGCGSALEAETVLGVGCGLLLIAAFAAIVMAKKKRVNSK